MPPTVCLEEPNPTICITMDGNTYSYTFSFADFLEMRLKFALHLDRNLPTEKRPTVPPSPINPISLSYTPGIPTDEVSGGVQILMWVWAKGEAV